MPGLTIPSTPYLHLVAGLLYLGGMLFIGGLLIPAARRLREGRSTLLIIAHLIKIVHPISLALLGLLIMTGASMLTDLKIALGGRYFSHLFATLGPKLLVVFVLALLNTYQFFGPGLCLTRSIAQEAEEQTAVTEEQVTAMLLMVGRLQRCAWTGFALGAVAAYLGVAIGHG